MQPMPNITFPKAKQRFTYPVRISVKANYDKRRKVIYEIKRMSDKRVIRRTSREIIDNLPVGEYCISMSYVGQESKTTPCIEFSIVKKPVKTEPLRRPIPQMVR